MPYTNKNYNMALLNKDGYVADIIENLNKRADFISRMKNLDAYVDNNILYFANEGAAPVIYVNPTGLPLTPAQRIDTAILTKLDQYVTQPTLVTDLESHSLTYDKRESVVGQHYRTLIDNLGDGVFAKLFAGNTGTSGAVTTPTPVYTIPAGETLSYKHMVKIQGMFNAKNIAQDNRHIELPSDMFDELLLDENVFKLYQSGMAAVRDGEAAVLRVAGINVHTRSTVATSNGKSAGFAYQSDCVAVAKGTTEVMSDSGDNGNGNPLWVGSLFNAVQWFGSVVLRPQGTVAVVRG